MLQFLGLKFGINRRNADHVVLWGAVLQVGLAQHLEISSNHFEAEPLLNFQGDALAYRAYAGNSTNHCTTDTDRECTGSDRQTWKTWRT